jgi:hypothetical protein
MGEEQPQRRRSNGKTKRMGIPVGNGKRGHVIIAIAAAGNNTVYGLRVTVYGLRL